MSSTAIAPVSSEPLPVPTFNGMEMLRALAAYRELQAALDKQMPDALQKIGDQHFRKKSYWRAIATAFALDVECVREEQFSTDTEWGYRVTYRARTRTGRVIEGDGACSSDEKRGNQATEHNIRSHAHTRAFNRAVSNAVGFGEVSAEEVVHEPAERPRPSRQSRPPRDPNDPRFGVPGRAPAVDTATGEIHEPPAAQSPIEQQLRASLEEQQRELITNADRKRLFAVAREVGWKEDELRTWLEKRGYEGGSTQKIKRTELEPLLAAIKAGDAPAPSVVEGEAFEEEEARDFKVNER